MKFKKGESNFMRKDAYENSKMKQQLLEKKRNGVQELIWKLNPEQVEFIQRKFGFSVVPYLFEVNTRQFHNIRKLEKILKEIHFKNKQGKRRVVFKLNDKEKDVLDEFGVKYRPFKYKIKLHQ